MKLRVFVGSIVVTLTLNVSVSAQTIITGVTLLDKGSVTEVSCYGTVTLHGRYPVLQLPEKRFRSPVDALSVNG